MKKQVKKKDPRQHILDTAACLIARKGFHAVGIREIASSAKVNISMISYYFGNKVGILKAINKVYFEKIGEILREISNSKKGHAEYFGKYIELLVDFFSEKRDYCRVAILELPIEHPEIINYKLEMVKINKSFVKNYLKNDFLILDKYQRVIIGPAFMGMAFSSFLLGEISRKMSGINYDKKFYKKYTKTISTLFLYGVHGIAKENKKCLNLK